MNDELLDLGAGNVIYQPALSANLRQSEPCRVFDATRKDVQEAIAKTKGGDMQKPYGPALDAMATGYDRITAFQRRINETAQDYGSTASIKQDREALAWALRGMAQLHGVTLRMVGFDRQRLATHFASSPARRAQARHFNITAPMLDAASVRRA